MGWPNSLPSLGESRARVPLRLSLPTHRGIAALTGSCLPTEAQSIEIAKISQGPPYATAPQWKSGNPRSEGTRAGPRPQAFPGEQPRLLSPRRAPGARFRFRRPGNGLEGSGARWRGVAHGEPYGCAILSVPRPCFRVGGTAVRSSAPGRDDSSRCTALPPRGYLFLSSPGGRGGECTPSVTPRIRVPGRDQLYYSRPSRCRGPSHSRLRHGSAVPLTPSPGRPLLSFLLNSWPSWRPNERL